MINIHRMMNREPIRNWAVNAFAARQIQYRPPLTLVFAKAVSYLAAYIDNNRVLITIKKTSVYEAKLFRSNWRKSNIQI